MKEFIRYAIVGIASNMVGYMAYLLLTFLHVRPKLAMTTVYFIGAVVGYLGNRQWTFVYKGEELTAVIKYTLVHICGYLINFLILYIFVERMFFPHQIVQAIAIIVVAFFLFFILKKVVFSKLTQVSPSLIK